jgi:hypothetical protein
MGMSYEDWKKFEEERKKERFEKFEKAVNEQLRAQGSDKTLADMMGLDNNTGAKDDPEFDGMLAVLGSIATATGDNFKAALGRSLGLYRQVIFHWQAGGSVQFVDADGNAKTLKCRIKRESGPDESSSP